jgi:hypothetical protein
MDHHYASDGRLILDGALQHNAAIPDVLKSKVLKNIRNDQLTKAVKTDTDILQFGSSLIRKLGPKSSNDVAQRMRQLARISLRLAALGPNKKAWRYRLDSFINGPGFDKLMDAVNAECVAFEDESGRQLFRNPNLALKVGHSLLRLAQLGSSTRARDSNAKADAESLIALYKSDFTDLVSTPAHTSVKRSPRTLEEFPDSTDLGLLKDYQIKTSQSLIQSLESQPSRQLWRDLAEVTMSRLLVFNARRGSEVADLRMTEYEKRTNYVHTNVLNNMSVQDQQMVQR